MQPGILPEESLDVTPTSAYGTHEKSASPGRAGGNQN